MDGKEFIELLSDPQKLEDYPVESLHRLAQDYPYSQPVQLLYTIRLSSSSEYLFNRQLGKTSILTDDRSVLFDLFERPEEVRSGRELPETDSDAASVVKDISDPDELPAPDKVEQSPRELPLAENAGAIEEAGQTEQSEPVRAPETTSKPTHPSQPLSPTERVQAILAQNRRLREEHGKSVPAEGGQTAIDRRVAEIKAKLEKLKQEKGAADRESHSANPEATPSELEVIAVPSAEKNQEAEPPATLAHGSEGEHQGATPAAAASSEGVDEEALLAAHEEKEEEIPLVDQADPETSREEPTFTLGEGVVFQIEAGEKSRAEEDKFAEEPGSFFDWLHRVDSGQARPGREDMAESSTGEGEGSDSFREKMQLLDSFVERLPELKKKKPVSLRNASSPVEVGKLSDQEDDSLVTETLAKVYLKQQHYQRAIKAYEILKLKYPEKSALFADQISEIKKLINSK